MDSNLKLKLVDFFHQGTHVSFKKGELLIRGQKNPPGIFLIEKGLVKMYAVSPEGEESTLNLFKEMAFFPMTWGLGEVSNRYFFEAINDVECWRLPVTKVRQFLKDNPDVLYDLSQRLMVGVSGLLTQMEKLMHGNSRVKVVNVLLLLASRFGEVDSTGNSVTIPIHFTHPELASLTGVTRETVSRELGKLKRNKIISYDTKELVINDVAVLKELVQDE